MKMMVEKRRLRRMLRWASLIFIAGAVISFGYCAFLLVDARLFQERQARELEQSIRAAGMRNVMHNGLAAPPVYDPKISGTGPIGRMEIARLGFSAVIVEGSDAAALRRGIGHIPGTSLPGQLGNVGIAGHRDTFFRPLRNIRTDDMIALTTLLGEYHYRVVSTSVVSPRRVSVLRPTGEEVLTLVTCYPFYFVGSAPDRFIVRARDGFAQPLEGLSAGSAAAGAHGPARKESSAPWLESPATLAIFSKMLAVSTLWLASPSTEKSDPAEAVNFEKPSRLASAL